ncbi:MAG: hypothetical protein PHR20_02500 [Bacteroidales bacterium]|nr:hypothetical protein [Bacteroidales bacterium]
MVKILNIEFLQLLLSMFISHAILGTPLYGAAVFLFAYILILSQRDSIKKIISASKNAFIYILLCLAVASGIALVLFFPSTINNARLNNAIFLILIMVFRDLVGEWFKNIFSANSRKTVISLIVLQIVSIGGMTWASMRVLSGTNLIIVVAAFAVTGIISALKPKNSGFSVNKELVDVASYKTFRSMMFYSRMALATGALMIIAYLSFRQTDLSDITYLIMIGWLVAVSIFYIMSDKVFKSNTKINVGMFIFGALAWIAGTICLFQKNSVISSLIYTFLFALGLSFINGTFLHFNDGFLMVLKLLGEDNVENEIKSYNKVTEILSLLMSCCIMLIILTIWCFVLPEFDSANAPKLFSWVIVQIPVVFMALSIYFALKQPLDAKSSEKLEHYLTVEPSADTNNSLYSLLVKKYRVRYGVKIIATFVRPFLHLKVTGKENIRRSEYPSIFVCNHGIFYGPIAAVLYLPTYFRPWVDRKMLDIDLASKEMYGRFMYRIPLLGPKAKMKLSRCLARPVTWALNSFNPIAVERDSLRNLMSTFKTTIQALKESDNILLFPERPAKAVISGRETVIHKTDSVGEMFSGFAKIGSMYWHESGKRLSFYPIYADKDRHTFNIGAPIIFNPDNHPNIEKERIVDFLRESMIALQG